MSFKNEVTLGNLISVGGVVAAVALGWGSLSSRLGAAEDRIEVLSKRIYDVEQDRKRSDEKLEQIRDRLATIDAKIQVQGVVVSQIAETVKALSSPPVPVRR